MKVRLFSVMSLIVILALLLSPVGGVSSTVAEGQPASVQMPPPAPDQARMAAGLQSAPLMFVENVGQFTDGARFQVRGGSGNTIPKASLHDTHMTAWRIQNVRVDEDSGALVSPEADPTWECWDTGEGPDPCRRLINSVSMVSASEGWAVGYKGLILRYVGGSWQLVNSPTTAALLAVDAVSSTEAWAVGSGGTILHYVSGTWNTFPSPTSHHLYGLDMLTPTDGWAVGCSGTILHYDGTDWQIEASPTSETLQDVAMVSADEGWAVGGYYPSIMLHYSNGTWSTTSIPSANVVQSLDMVSDSEGWAVGGSNGDPAILHYSNESWQRQDTPWWGWLEDVYVLAPDDVWAVGAFSGVYHYDGTTWQQVTLSSYIYTINTVAMVSPDEGWALGDAGAILHYVGGTWNLLTPEHLHSVAAVPGATEGSDEAWAVGDAGTILHFDGEQWEAIASPTSANLQDVVMLSSTKGWAVGDGGTILHYSGTWETFTSPTTANLLAIDALSSTEAWAVGSGGVTLHFQGSAWHEVNAPTSESPKSISLTSPGNGWAVTEHTILRLADGVWEVAPNPAIYGLGAVDMANASDGWIVGIFNTKLHYTEGSWQVVSQGAGSCLYALDLMSSAFGWSAGYSGTIWRFSGGDWSRDYSTPTSTSIKGIAIIGQGRAWMVGDGGLILRYMEPAYSISGRVRDGSGSPIPGVVISAGAAGGATTNTDGYYVLSGVIAGTYTLTPSKTGCLFTPSAHTVSVPPDATGQDFEGRCTFDISGRVYDVNGNAFAGVTVWAGPSRSAVTDASGAYTITNLLAGTYTLTPTLSEHTFWPSNRTVTLPPDAIGQNFTILPGSVSTTLTPGTATLLIYTDTQGLTTTLTLPAGAVTQTTMLVLTPTLATGGAGFAFAGHAFDLAAFQGGSLQPGFTFSTPVTVTIRYSDDDVRVVTNESRLVLWWWTGSEWQDVVQTCEPASSYTRNVVNKVLSVPICHLSLFGLFGPTHQTYLPLILRNC